MTPGSVNSPTQKPQGHGEKSGLEG